MKPTLRTKLDSLVARRADLERLLAAEDATRDLERFRNQSREHSELSSIVSLYERFRQSERVLQGSDSFLGIMDECFRLPEFLGAFAGALAQRLKRLDLIT